MHFPNSGVFYAMLPYLWGGLILAIGLLNGFQMIRSIKLEEDRKKLI
jgi:hypothetical protein